MTSYKLSKIYLENFKLIKNSLYIDNLAENELVVFDGPNGFGKTTVFDALEIALTGEVYRIFGTKIVPGNQGATDCIFLNEQDRPMKIVIEFVKGAEKKILFVFGKKGNQLSASEKKADNRNYFKRFELANFDDFKNYDNIPTTNELSQLNINEWFKGVDLGRYYKLYHYIQQAETTFFLKQKEDERMKQLGVLFDTQKEEDDKNKTQEYFNNVNSEIQNLSNSLTEKNKALSLLETPLNSENSNESEINYKQLFSELQYAPEWDNEKLIDIRAKDTQGISKRDTYKIDINKLSDFIKSFADNFVSYENFNINTEIENKIRQKQLIEDTILISAFIDRMNDIKKIYDKQNLRIKYSHTLPKENLLQNLFKIDFKSLLIEMGIENQYELIDLKIKQIELLKTKESELSEVIRDFDNTRDRILELFNLIIKNESQINDSECPLCGYVWDKGYNQLLKEIENKKSRIKKLQSENSIVITNLFDELFSTYIQPIIESNNTFLNDENNKISDAFYNQINIDDSRQKQVRKFIAWLKLRNIDIALISHKDYNKELNNIDEKTEQLISLLRQTKKNISDSFIYDEFNLQFDDFFSKEAKKVELITLEDLAKKIKFIDQEYYKGNQKEKNILEKEIEFVKNIQLPKFEAVRIKINEILKAYDEEIQNHRIEIAKNIEVPFFIYSSKILQNFEKGVGVFIQFKQSTRTENLKFTQGMDTSHDVLHSMSSGQLSALVIAFTLAMNKIYDESSIGVLLIDDPVQTMDEINMSSLIDLLRNDFSNKQIILSTHEDAISAFMRFKFYNFNRKTIPINMKDKQFEQIT
jgi:exonuclease SbcC